MPSAAPATAPPRLIDLTWGRGRTAPQQITLVGKGIAFDTGGLDIKPASGMLIMKKDMGGAASALALGHMVMAAKLDVRLRILIPAAENSIAGNAFRPGDVLPAARAGRSRSATPMRKAAWCSPTRWRWPTRSGPMRSSASPR